MNVVYFEDIKTKKLVQELEERMDYAAATYLDLMIEYGERMYDENMTDKDWQDYCECFASAFGKSLEKAFEEKGL